MKQLTLPLIIMVLLALSVTANDINTGSMNPEFVSLCGGFSTETTITASSITSNVNDTIEDLSAKLIIPQDGVLSITTPQTIGLGNLSPADSFDASWTVKCIQSKKANYTLYVEYGSSSGHSENSLNDATTNISIFPSSDITPPQILDSEPSGKHNGNINLTVETNEKATCRYDISEEEYDDMRNSFSNTGNLVHKDLLVLGSGEYKYYIRCQDEAGNPMTSSEIVTFTIDSSSPEIEGYSPTRVLTSFTSVNLTTNEYAKCRYSTQEGVSYDEMDKKFIGTTKTHTITLSQLEKGENIYYVKCKDRADNINDEDYVLEIVRDPTPTATIELSDTSPLKPGVIKVTLTTSEEMQTIPTLKFTLDGEDEKSVILTGEEKEFEGFMILDATETEKIGLFTYEGTDVYGNEGDQITDGAIFIVDPDAPGKVVGLRIKRLDPSTIMLTWDEPSEKIDRYYVYRSTKKNLTKDDYHAVVTTTKYKDRNASGSFYYSLIAVDEADNEGLMSTSVNSEKSIIQDEEEEQQQYVSLDKASNMQEEIDFDEIEEQINKISADLRDARTKLRERDAQDVSLLDLISQTRQGDLEIRELRNAFKSAKDKKSISEAKDIQSRIDALLPLLPKTMHVVEADETKKSYKVNSVSDAVTVLLEGEGKENSGKARRDYIKTSEENGELFPILQKIKKVVIEYMDGSEKEFTLVVHEVNLNSLKTSQKNKISYVITIPKEVAEHAQDAHFMEDTVHVVKEDPVVRLDYKRMKDKVVAFYVEGSVSISDAADTEVVVFSDLDSFLRGEMDSVTGLSIGSGTNDFALPLIWIVLAVFVMLGSYVAVRPPEVVKNKFKKDFGTLVKQANDQITKGKVEAAQATYLKLVDEYQKLQGKPEANAAYQQLVGLYQKLGK